MDTAKRWLPFVVLIALLALMALATPGKQQQEDAPLPTTGIAPEIDRIKNITSVAEQSRELTKLLDRVGPVKAQEEMLRSGMPFTGQTHLLIHTIGDYIYNKYGLQGLSMCRDYFLSACYHGFIINVLSDHGLDGVAEALNTCKSAAPSVFAQCAHAAGHGFVAWQDYDLVKGLNMCDDLAGKVPGFPSFNCYDGAFMENVWGVHDGKPSEKRWVKPEVDLYYPCTDSRIAERYLPACWANQATLMYQYFKADLKKTAQACDGVENPAYKEMCYNNFARQIHPLTEGKAENVLNLCQNATGQYWQEYCMLSNMTAAWSVGDRTMPYELCGGATGATRTQCFDRLVSVINFDYANSPSERTTYCDKISDATYVRTCENYTSSARQ